MSTREYLIAIIVVLGLAFTAYGYLSSLLLTTVKSTFGNQ